MANAKKHKSDAKIEGIQIQQMLLGGQEVIVGAVTDGSFGKLVAFGLGGVLVEVLKNITFRLSAGHQGRCAVDAGRHSGRMKCCEERACAAADPANRDAIADIIVNNVSKLISIFPRSTKWISTRYSATKTNAIAADVRIVVDFDPKPPRPRPNHDDIVRQMNRIMKPKAVAVIGASARKPRQDRPTR